MIFGAVVALTIAALLLAARPPRHRVLLVLIAYSLADELLVEALHRKLFIAKVAPVWHAIQAHGWPARAAYHLETAVVLGWPALLAAAAWRVFAGPQKTDGPVSQAVACRRSGSVPARRRHHSLGGEEDSAADLAPQARNLWAGVTTIQHKLTCAWFITAGGLATCYPLPRGWTAPALHAAEVFFVVAALAALPVGWRRRTLVTPAGQIVGLLVVVELVVCVLGAWASGSRVFSAEVWDVLARVPYAMGWAAVCCILVGCQRRSPCPPPSSSLPR